MLFLRIKNLPFLDLLPLTEKQPRSQGREERAALENLSKRRDIIVKAADKGGVFRG